MNKLIAIAIASVFFFAAAPAAEAGTQTTSYVTAGHFATTSAGSLNLAITGISCAAGGHEYVPIGDVEDYEDPLGWAFSGEPECLPGDVISGDGTSAINMVAFEVQPEERGSEMTVTANDENFDATGMMYINGDGDWVHGCGAISGVVPEDLSQHWQSSDDNPYYIFWVRVYASYTNADTLETCFGSVGELTGVW